jgi:hypothetical protein
MLMGKVMFQWEKGYFNGKSDISMEQCGRNSSYWRAPVGSARISRWLTSDTFLKCVRFGSQSSMKL